MLQPPQHPMSQAVVSTKSKVLHFSPPKPKIANFLYSRLQRHSKRPHRLSTSIQIAWLLPLGLRASSFRRSRTAHSSSVCHEWEPVSRVGWVAGCQLSDAQSYRGASLSFLKLALRSDVDVCFVAELV